MSSPPDLSPVQSTSARLDGAAEPCPAPLNWEQVLDQVNRESDHWQLAAVDGAIIHGWTLGTGQPLYFLNSLAGDSRLFALTAFLLRESFRCVLWDWPGDPSRSRRLTDYVDDVLRVADSQQDDRFSLLAAGWGGLVALQAAGSQPRRVCRLVLQGCSARRRLGRLEQLLLQVAAWCPGTVGQCPGFRRVQTMNHAPWFPPFDASRLQFLLANLGSTSLSDFAARGLLMHRSNLSNLLPQITQPVLAIHVEGEGRQEQAGLAQLEAGLPAVRIESMHTCGLFPQLTHPHRYRKLVESFLLESQSS